MALEPLILCENLVKIYRIAKSEVIALQGLDLSVMSGEMVALAGTSGSGKTTLMNILGGLDTPTAGRCLVAGNDLLHLREAERLNFRRTTVGHIWQQSGRNLIAQFDARRNIELPMLALGLPTRERTHRAEALLETVGLAAKGAWLPGQLSGGEQQRVSLAVALANEPQLLLADEPTGELDSITATQIIDLLRELNRTHGLTVLIVTHDSAVAAGMDRVLAIRDGRTSSEALRRAGSPSSDGQAATTLTTGGVSTATHREAIVVDKVGRLQLPRHIFDRLQFNGRAEVREATDHLEIWPLTEK